MGVMHGRDILRVDDEMRIIMLENETVCIFMSQKR